MTTSHYKPCYDDCDGFRIAAGLSPEACRSIINYKPRPGDIFIDTYPKCGTTWMQHIVMSILKKGKPFADPLDFYIGSPFLEMTGADFATYMKGPGALKSHLPFHLLPYSPDAKYIYVARNPKDCCVSFYYHTRMFGPYHFVNGSFEDYFDVFIKGEVDWGDYFDHLLGWYERRNEPNVYFTTYEKLKKDRKKEVIKVAEFLGEEYKTCLLENQKILDDVLYYSSFEYMKIHMNNMVEEFYGKLIDGTYKEEEIPVGFRVVAKNIRKDMEENEHLYGGKKEMNFIRKGIVGDWKNHFTADQVLRLEERITEKTSGSDVMDLWKDSN